MLRNTATFERIKKKIMSGKYNIEELKLDIADFLDMGTLTQSEHDQLLELMIQYPPTSIRRDVNVGLDENNNLVSDSIYVLLEKQIYKMAYKMEVIEQIVTDFRITEDINREQFKELNGLISKVYNPVIEEIPVIDEVVK